MNSEELELFPSVITSGRNSDNCDIPVLLIEIYKERRKMHLHEIGKVVLYIKVLCKKNVQASQCVCSMYRVYVSRTYGTFLTEPTLQAANYALSHQRDCPLVFIVYIPRGCINEAF